MSEIKYIDCAVVKEKLEYKNAYGPMSPRKFAELLESIRTVGQLMPVIVNQNFVVIDGHQRLEACRQLGIEVLIEIREFKDEIEEKRLMHICNLNRRQLTPFAMIEAVVNDEPFVMEEARRRQLVALRRGSVAPLVCTQTDEDEKGRSDQRCADWAGVKRHTYLRVRALIKNNKLSEELKIRVRNGEIDLKTLLKMFPEEKSAISKPRPFHGESYIVTDRLTMIRGSFVEISEQQILPNSLDLVFPTTDPSYDMKKIRELAKFASRFLNEKGFLVVFSQPGAIGMLANAVRRHAKDLRLLTVSEIYFPAGWINVDKKNGLLKTLAATYLVFWKIKEIDDSQLDFPFGGPYSIEEDILSKDDNSDMLIIPEEANQHAAEHLLKQLNLKSGVICDPVCQSCKMGIKVVKDGWSFVGIEEDSTQFKISMAAMEEYLREVAARESEEGGSTDSLSQNDYEEEK